MKLHDFAFECLLHIGSYLLNRTALVHNIGSSLPVNRLTLVEELLNALAWISDVQQGPFHITTRTFQYLLWGRVKADNDTTLFEQLQHTRLYDEAPAAGYDTVFVRMAFLNKNPLHVTKGCFALFGENLQYRCAALLFYLVIDVYEPEADFLSYVLSHCTLACAHKPNQVKIRPCRSIWIHKVTRG